MALPKAITWRDHVLGALLASAYVGWLLVTAKTLGFPRDEGFYFRAANEYARWFRLLADEPSRALEPGVVDAMWSYNHEHPSLAKSLFAFGWIASQKYQPNVDPSTLMRLPAMMLGGLTLWITYMFGARAYSRRAGLVAAALLGFMPHVFFHAHLACFDIPIVAMWTLFLYVYWRSVGAGTFGWALLTGLVYGLALETKHNAWMLPAVVIPHTILLQWRAPQGAGGLGRGQLGRGRLGRRLSTMLNLLAMVTVGPAVFVLLWPWLWHDTVARIGEYVGFHVNHEYYNIEFLHKNYFGPPSPILYAPVMIAASVPAITLLLFFVGLGSRLRRMGTKLRETLAARAPLASVATRGATDALFLLAIGVALGPFVLPRTPIFGGTKHWMTAYPFLALFAGWGFEVTCAAAERAVEASWPRARQWAGAALGAVVLAGPLVFTAHSHPFGLLAYTPLVGGTAGGADLGLPRSFWGYLTQNVNPYLEANARPGARVYLHDTAWDSWSRLQAERRVRPDLVGVGAPGDADFGLIQYELHMLETDYQHWMVFGPAPAFVLSHDGVPFVSVYRP